MPRIVAICFLSFVFPAAVASAVTTVPDSAAIKSAEAEVRRVYKAEYAKRATADRVALAGKLRKEAESNSGEPAAQYVLFREARDLYAQAGELDDALEVVDAQSHSFQIDIGDDRVSVVTALPRPVKDPVSAAKVAVDAMKVAEELEQFAEANKAAAAAKTILTSLKDKELTQRFQTEIADLPKWVQEHGLASAAKVTLKTMPEDAAAKLAFGSYECFRHRDWDQGLPALAKSSNKILAALATDDLNVPTDPAAKIALAERWWNYGSEEWSPDRAAARERAVHWYQVALPDLSGLRRSAAEKRLASIAVPVEGWLMKRASYVVEAPGNLFKTSDPTVPQEGELQWNLHSLRIWGTKKTDGSTSHGVAIWHYGTCAVITGIRSASGSIEVGKATVVDHTEYGIMLPDAHLAGSVAPLDLREQAKYQWSIAQVDETITMSVLKDNGETVATTSIPAERFYGFAFTTSLRYQGDRSDLRVGLDRPLRK